MKVWRSIIFATAVFFGCFAPSPPMAQNAIGAPADAWQQAFQRGVAAIEAEDPDVAHAELSNALLIARSTQNKHQLIESLSRLSKLSTRHTNYADALRYEKELLALIDPDAIEKKLASIGRLAVLYEQLELHEEAAEYYLKAIKVAQQAIAPIELARAETQYAGFLNDFGEQRAKEAFQLASKAWPMIDSQGTDNLRASNLLQLGRASLSLEKRQEAYDYFKRALTFATASKAMAAHIEMRLGEWHWLWGQPDEGNMLLERASETYAALGNRHRLMKMAALRAELYTRIGDNKRAANFEREYQRLRSEIYGLGGNSQISKLLRDISVQEERLRADEFDRRNQLSELRVAAERRTRNVAFAATAVIALLLALLFWRFHLSMRLNQKLTLAHEELKARSAALYHATITDPLTSLRNRRYVLSELEQCMQVSQAAQRAVDQKEPSQAAQRAVDQKEPSQAAQRAVDLKEPFQEAENALAQADSTSPVCFATLDIDHFKQINDRWGHLAGDEALQHFAHVLVSTVPTDSLVGRMGGEEFIVMQRDMGADEFIALMQKVCRNIAAKPLSLAGGPVCMTVSVGIAFHTLDSPASTADLLQRADQALYRAKSEGRNQVCVHEANVMESCAVGSP
jgi:diguanylate cyclase (GGDEF)-like protein